MELQKNKICVISVGIGAWYAKGVERLESSLNFHGFPSDVLTWKDVLPPGAVDHALNPYNYKVWAFKAASRLGYTHILWCDASFWAIKNIMPLFDYFNEHGIFAFRSGYNCAQTAPDILLNYCAMDRDAAEKLPEYASGCIGLNLKNDKAVDVFNTWSKMCHDGMFMNSRTYDPSESADPRYKFGRQDQISWSLALHLNQVVIPQTEFVSYYKPDFHNDQTVFFIGGL